MTVAPDTAAVGDAPALVLPAPATAAVTPEVVEAARARARDAARRAGVRLRELHGIDDMRAAAEVLDRVWGTGSAAGRTGDQQLDPRLMVALHEAGGYLVGVAATATDADTDDAGDAPVDGELIGAAVGFPRWPEGLHSHIAGVLPGSALRGVGTALKLHQRAWCLERGIRSVLWTFDPLVSRNAHLNLVTLGAVAERYLVDVYGPMDDALNRGDPSDRLLVRWDLLTAERHEVSEPTARVLLRDEGGHPASTALDPAGGPARVGVPADIEGLRRTDPALALKWRLAVRDALTTALAAGLTIVGFDDHHYVLEGRA
ncbi:hypothetical protein [Terracoccus luteus]|uniref:Putative GNAT superfamily acetyltransferase n=1 Tax=Terracoccus luteus TaxID=53356 RepID=A0A495Y2Q5_9MICO|nr:hypothetical protein [Terracoccus luteus]MBB2986606.1 putative GNAT superfamily acetyltransferase [Terracoccus luteus]MCP2171805.1 putative GNAT superfamily acetyltransferase [Terracoccus luteus]RKT79356.1 putative GNAT superfamily acetyltransferase [Terracoccus luteus]